MMIMVLFYRTYYSLLSDFLILWLFQKAAKTYGVPDTEVFQTPDLFEARNVPQVQTVFLVKLSIDIILYSLLQTDISPRYCFLFFVGDVMHLLFGKNDSETPRVWWTNHGAENGHRKQTKFYRRRYSKRKRWANRITGKFLHEL